MVLKPFFLRCFKTLFFHGKTEGPGLKPYEKIAFSAVKALKGLSESRPGLGEERQKEESQAAQNSWAF